PQRRRNRVWLALPSGGAAGSFSAPLLLLGPRLSTVAGIGGRALLLRHERRHVLAPLHEIDSAILVDVPLILLGLEVFGHLIIVEQAIPIAVEQAESLVHPG